MMFLVSARSRLFLGTIPSESRTPSVTYISITQSRTARIRFQYANTVASRRSVVPLTGLAMTTKGAGGSSLLRPDLLFVGFFVFFLKLGDKETGGQVTGLTLSNSIADKS